MTGPAASMSSRASTRAYATFLTLGVLDAAGYSVIVPVLPSIAEATGAGPAMMGLLVGTFPLGMVAGFAVAGAAVQRTPPTRIIVAGLCVIGVGCTGFVAGSGLGVYALARLVMGAGSGFLWLGVTFATLSCWPGQEYRCMSRVFAAYSVGGLLGPVLGAIDGVRGPFLAYLALIGAGTVLALGVRLPPDVPTFTPDRRSLRRRGFWVAAAGITFAAMALGTLEGVLPLHFGAQYTQRQIGALYAGTAVLVASSAALAARLRPRTALVGAVLVVVAGVAAAGGSGAVWVWPGALAVAGAGIGLANTGSMGILLDAVPAQRIVTAMVIWSQLGIVGYLLGPTLGGAAAESFGFAAAAVPLAVAAAVVLAAMRWDPRPG